MRPKFRNPALGTTPLLALIIPCVFAVGTLTAHAAEPKAHDLGDRPQATTLPSPPASQFSELWGTDGQRWTSQSRLPDYSFAGYHFGGDPIPDVPIQANVRDFGATGDGDSDDTLAFKNAMASVSSGAVYVPAGRYNITEILKVTRSNLVLRGAGRNQTILYFPKSLTEILGRAPDWAGIKGSGSWSWAGGVLWCEGRESGTRLTSVTASSRRGDATLTVASASDLSVGMTIRLVQHDALDRSLGEHLHAGYAKAGRGLTEVLEGRFVDWAARVSRLSGNRVTLDRPLRVDVRPEWKPEIFSSVPSVREVGLEDFTIEFPNAPYAGHHIEKGYNGIFMVGVHHSWVRNVTILDSDSGINIHNPDIDFDLTIRNLATSSTISRAVTVTGLRLANQWRNKPINGHHGIAFEAVQDCLATDFVIDTQFEHDLTVDGTSCGNVFSRGRGRNINLDHHRGAPYENLFTQIDAGTGRRLWEGSGHGDQGPASGAGETVWNVLATDPPAAVPDWPRLNLVGMTNWTTLKTDRTWIEAIAPQSLTPPNLYEAQLARRRESNLAPVSSRNLPAPGSAEKP